MTLEAAQLSIGYRGRVVANALELQLAVGSSAHKDELKALLRLCSAYDLIDELISADDVDRFLVR